MQGSTFFTIYTSNLRNKCLTATNLRFTVPYIPIALFLFNLYQSYQNIERKVLKICKIFEVGTYNTTQWLILTLYEVYTTK